MQFITLLTDFGLQDGYPGIMKGVILGIAPQARFADITHLISPQNILEGALALHRSYRYFPSGSIHIAVVDPGVGTARRPIAAHIGEHTFVGPDNGIFTVVIQEAVRAHWKQQIIHLTKPEYWLPNPSNVFHGRDIFAPVAAHLAAGVSIDELGEPIADPVTLELAQPMRDGDTLTGQVIAIDYFGNLSTNIFAQEMSEFSNPTIFFGAHSIHGLVNAFGDRPEGELIALIGPDQELMISVVNGNAREVTGCGVGQEVTVRQRKPSP